MTYITILILTVFKYLMDSLVLEKTYSLMYLFLKSLIKYYVQ
jgi:hypothetical protein